MCGKKNKRVHKTLEINYNFPSKVYETVVSLIDSSTLLFFVGRYVFGNNPFVSKIA